jgi:hypothetical protein
MTTTKQGSSAAYVQTLAAFLSGALKQLEKNRPERIETTGGGINCKSSTAINCNAS